MPSYVVTGASRGIGLAFIKFLGKDEQNTVFGIVRNKDTVGKFSDIELPNVHLFESDVTDHEALKRVASEVSKVTGGTLDMLINNAAIASSEYLSLDEFTDGSALNSAMYRSIDTNVLGVIHATNAFLPLLRAGKMKKVVCITTGLADAELAAAKEIPFDPIYSISKAAMNMAVAKYAANYKKDGFVFLAISPGVVQTQSLANKTPDELAYLQRMFVKFQEVYPHFSGPLMPEESVKAMLGVVEKTKVEDSGAFISHKGNKEWL